MMNREISRKLPRMYGDFIVAYRPLESAEAANPPRLARTRTVGLGGCMFEATSPLQVGERFRIELIIENYTIDTPARVVHVNRRRDDLYHIGVEFTEISEENRGYLLNCYLQREYRIAPG